MAKATLARLAGEESFAHGAGYFDVGAVSELVQPRVARYRAKAAPGGTMNPFVIGLAGGSMRSAAKTTTPQKGSHLARMRSLGLVGCIKDGPRDLAQNHKKYLRLALRAKYRPR